MIVSAIESLKDRKGSSKTAIAKYIVANYTHLPLKHDALLAHHLRRLKKKGVIRMIKHSYKLATSGGAPLILPQGMKPIIPKKRGRPPKNLTGTEKRKPGRPRKVLAQEGIGPPTEKRKPGKPRKGSSVAELILPKSMKSMLNAERRKPGRPKKGSSPFKLKPAAVVAVGERRKPGRPKKGSSPIKLKPAAAKAVGEKKKPGRPKKGSSPIKLKSAAAVAVGEKRKPGRLKKVLSAVEDGDGSPRPQNTVGGALVVVKHGGGGTPSKPVFSLPKKTLGEVAAVGSPEAVTPLSVATSGERKKRGRPKKGLTPFTLAAVKDDDGMLPLTTTKRRGRPPKKSDMAAPEKMGSEKKRSVGRPKKNVEV